MGDVSKFYDLCAYGYMPQQGSKTSFVCAGFDTNSTIIHTPYPDQTFIQGTVECINGTIELPTELNDNKPDCEVLQGTIQCL